MSAEEHFETDLASLLSRLSRQLGQTQDLGREVEEAIDDLNRKSGSAGSATLGSFQKLDMLAQSLDSLAVNVDTLAASAPGGTLVDRRDAVKRVKQRAFRMR